MSDVAAVVLGSRGGARLARALESVAWARERVVLDPGRRLAAEPLPAGVVRVPGAELPATLAAPWLLLVDEGERVPADLAREIASATTAGAPSAWRIPAELAALGVRVRPRGAAVRLARRPGVRLRFAPGLHAEVEGPAPSGRLPIALERAGPPTLAEAVAELDADAATLAALLHARAVRPRLHHLVLPPLAATLRHLRLRGDGAWWARWAVAVLAGYRALVAYAKLWELREREGAAR
jgi:hypothetical protein